MSLLTRCPACATWFKVVPDHLRVAQGWVRCGQCAEVFDASVQLMEQAAADTRDPPDAGPGAPDSAESVLAIESEPPASPTVPVDDAVIEPVWRHESAGPVVIDPSGPVEPQLEPEPPPQPDPQLQAQPQLDSQPSDPVEPSLDAGYGIPASYAWANTPAKEPPSRSRRVALGLICLLLAVLLALQVLVSQRDWLAARWPVLVPRLQAMCLALGCRIEPLRQFDAVVIEASAFQHLQADRFQLSATVRNTATWTVAMPAIELVLTDAQDTALLRRVLQASELGVSPTLPPRAELSLARELSVLAPVDAAAVAGYRLALFHPS